MARASRSKTGTFFLRQNVTMNSTTFNESSLDISSFVNPLQGEVLRIKQTWTAWTEGSQPITGDAVHATGAAGGASCGGQVTTASRTGLIALTNNDLVTKSTLYAHVDATANIDYMKQQEGLNPVEFDDGYMVATDTLYFGINSNDTDTWAKNSVIMYSVMLECEVVKLSLSDAQAFLVIQTQA